MNLQIKLILQLVMVSSGSVTVIYLHILNLPETKDTTHYVVRVEGKNFSRVQL